MIQLRILVPNWRGWIRDGGADEWRWKEFMRRDGCLGEEKGEDSDAIVW